MKAIVSEEFGSADALELREIRKPAVEGGDTMRVLTTTPRTKDLQFISELIEAGSVRPVIDRTYPLSDVADAIRYLETGRARGKVVISVSTAVTPTSKEASYGRQHSPAGAVAAG